MDLASEFKAETLSNGLDSGSIVDDLDSNTDTDNLQAENLSLKPIIETPSTGPNSNAQTPTLPSGQSLMEFSLAMLFQQTNSLLKVGQIFRIFLRIIFVESH